MVKTADGRPKLRSMKDTEEEAKANNNEVEADPECYECGTCKKPVGYHDSGVSCEICESWFHCRCQGISDVLYKALNQFSAELHWFCNSCNSGAGKLFMIISKMHTKMDRLEDEMVRMKAEFHADMVHSMKAIRDDLQKLEGRMTKCEKNADENKQELCSSVDIKLAEFENKLQCDKTPQWSDIVSKEVETKMLEVTSDMTTVQNSLEETKLLLQEQKDKEARANNVIVYNIAETTVMDRKERMMQEKTFCLKIFNDILNVKDQPEDIKRMLRLGKPEENKCKVHVY